MESKRAHACRTFTLENYHNSQLLLLPEAAQGLPRPELGPLSEHRACTHVGAARPALRRHYITWLDLRCGHLS